MKDEITWANQAPVIEVESCDAFLTFIRAIQRDALEAAEAKLKRMGILGTEGYFDDLLPAAANRGCQCPIPEGANE